jgi:hypothetical protein
MVTDSVRGAVWIASSWVASDWMVSPVTDLKIYFGVAKVLIVRE